MQDIPRNELLDKLAAGWKVRKKSWGEKTWTKDQLQGKPIVNWDDVLEDDWEGEPPGPVKNYDGLDMLTAFRHLRGGAAFVRRVSERDEIKVRSTYSIIGLSTCDILANDWEVWG